MGSRPDPRYVEAWRRMRRWRRLFWAAVLVVTLGTVTSVILFALGTDGSYVVANWVIVIAAFMMLYVLGTPKCPRCKAPFAGGGSRGLWLSDECQHCGLPFGAERDPHGGE